MVRNAVPFDKRQKVRRCEAGERRFAEMRAAVADEIVGADIEIGEVAPSTAGDEDLVSQARRVFQHHNRTPAPSRRDGAHQTRRATADDCHIKSHARSKPEGRAGEKKKASGP